MTNRIVVCVEHGFMINKTYTSIKNTVHKKCNVTCKHYSNRLAYKCLLFLVFQARYISVHVFCFRNTHRTHTEYDWLVYWLAFCFIDFEDPINIYLFRNRRVKVLAWPRGYKTFFVFVLRLVLRTRSLCSIEYDTKNRGYKSFGVRSPLSWI